MKQESKKTKKQENKKARREVLFVFLIFCFIVFLITP
jgi:hypothetical protein